MAALFDREHEPPEPSESDVAYDLVKTVISAVPGAALVFDHVFGSPFQRRQQEWMEGVAGDLRRLERERGITLETMRDNPAFIDAAFSAYQAFIKTSDEQKRAALRNAVLNSAMPGAPPIVDQQVFVSLVDRLTPLHLAVLGFFRDPAAWRSSEGQALSSYRHRVGTPRDVLEEAFPQLAGANRPLADLIWAELTAANLVRNVPLDNSGEGPDGITRKRVTEFGDRFIRFISDPWHEPR